MRVMITPLPKKAVDKYRLLSLASSDQLVRKASKPFLILNIAFSINFHKL